MIPRCQLQREMVTRILIATTLGLSIGFGARGICAEKRSVPNIVLILADDLGYGDVACYNNNSKIPTPHLDRLASEGIRLTDAHAPTSVCSPTRYALLTGRYAWRTRLQRGVLAPWGRPLIAADRLTVPVAVAAARLRDRVHRQVASGLDLADEGRAKRPTAGTDRLSNVDFTRPITDGPTTRGFDYYFGTDVPNYPPYCFLENDRTVGIPSLPTPEAPDGSTPRARCCPAGSWWTSCPN